MSTIPQVTVEQYDEMIARGDFDGPHRRRAELIYGEVYEMSPIGSIHEEIVDLLMQWSFEVLPSLAARVRVQHSIGVPELDSAPEPDIAWVASRSYREGRPRPSDVLLIIEVANSSLAFDRDTKAELYASAGVQDYWIVNIPDQGIEVHRQPEQTRFHDLQSFRPGDAVSPLSFPDVFLDVATLFPESGSGE